MENLINKLENIPGVKVLKGKDKIRVIGISHYVFFDEFGTNEVELVEVSADGTIKMLVDRLDTLSIKRLIPVLQTLKN